jgi:hypothetical protein
VAKDAMLDASYPKIMTVQARLKIGAGDLGDGRAQRSYFVRHSHDFVSRWSSILFVSHNS